MANGLNPAERCGCRAALGGAMLRRQEGFRMDTALATALPIRVLPGPMGAVLEGFDARSVTPAQVPALLEALARHGVLILRDQSLRPEDLLAFARLLGPLEEHVLADFAKPGFPDIFVLSNIVENGRPIGSTADGFGWHTDLGYLRTPTATTLLYSVISPKAGGDTLFCNTEAALASLPAEEQARLRALRTRQSYLHMYNKRYRKPGYTGHVPELPAEKLARLPDVEHPLVRRHPLTGTSSLYLGGNSLAGFVGLEEAEGTALAARLFALCTEERFQYRHAWRDNDLVLWDNRGTMHTATAYDKDADRRLVWRVSVRGEEPVAG